MGKNNRLRFTEIVLLVLIWLIIIASPILFRKDVEINWTNLSGPFQTIIPLFIIFLINRFILVPQLLFRRKNILYFVSTGLLVAFMTTGIFLLVRGNDPGTGRETTERNMPPRPHPERANPGMPPHLQESAPGPGRGGPIPPFANFLIFSILLIGFDTGLRISFRLAEAERMKDKLEKDNVESQLAFLRNQVSPHFFMNTLNNIHSLIDIDQREAKESIIRLSKLMRHLLYDSEYETIPIQKEMEFIRNYVDLMKLRFSDKVEINLKIHDQLPEKKIPPLLFTSYLENAFKHGISYQHSSFINISISYANGLLSFEIRNSNATQEQQGNVTGIGIENSRKRLDLLYGKQYSLEISDEKDEYHVNLRLPV